MLLAVHKYNWPARPGVGSAAILACALPLTVMFVDPALQIGCNSGIQRSIVTSYDVHIPRLCVRALVRTCPGIIRRSLF